MALPAHSEGRTAAWRARKGFAIVAMLEAGGPGWLAATVGVAGLAVGHTLISRLKRTVLTEATSRG